MAAVNHDGRALGRGSGVVITCIRCEHSGGEAAAVTIGTWWRCLAWVRLRSRFWLYAHTVAGAGHTQTQNEAITAGAQQVPAGSACAHPHIKRAQL